MGSSAGLNLRLDHFRYGGGGVSFGPTESPVDLSGLWLEAPPHLPARLDVVERRGCDLRPIDIATAEGRLQLESSLWADQVARLTRLRGAFELAARIPATVERALRRRVAAARPRRAAARATTTVVFHSIVYEYFPEPVRLAFHQALETAGARASSDAPLAWLRFEVDSSHAGLRNDAHHLAGRRGARGRDGRRAWGGRAAASVTPPTDARPITGEELAGLPDSGPCELVLGRIVPMSPTGGEHGRVEGNFCEAIRAFVRPRNLGKVLVGEIGIFTHRGPDTVRGADVAFISNERYARLKSNRGFLDVAPELVVEVLSPDDRPGELEPQAAGILRGRRPARLGRRSRRTHSRPPRGHRARLRASIRSSTSSARKTSGRLECSAPSWARIAAPVDEASSQRARRTTSEKDSRSDFLALRSFS